MLKYYPIKFLLLFILIVKASFAQRSTDQLKIDFLLSKFSENSPGLSYMVIHDGKVLENENYGLANIKKKQKTNNKTNYRLASVTKQFTALSILMLIEKNKLEFSTVLTEIFNDFPAYGNDITIQQLLTHTSGLLDYENLMKDDRIEPILDHEVLELMKQQTTTKFTPGSKYDYSNSAYAVLAQVIEIKSGKTFKAYIESKIFEHLKMKNSVVYTKDSKIKNRAFGYTIKNNIAVFSDQSMTSSVQGDGGIYTSINDYFKWDQALENDILISSKLKNKAYSMQSKIPVSEWDYGYGWRIKYDEKIKIVSHSGHTSGFTNYVVKIPAQRLTIVLFSNRKNDDTVIEIGNLLLKKYKSVNLKY